MGDFFLKVTNRAFFAFKLVNCPVKRRNQAGSSRNDSDYSRERYPDQFSGWIGFLLRPLVMGDFFLKVTNRAFFAFKLVNCPVKRRNQASSSRNDSDYPRERVTQISFPLLESRSSETFGLAHFSIA